MAKKTVKKAAKKAATKKTAKKAAKKTAKKTVTKKATKKVVKKAAKKVAQKRTRNALPQEVSSEKISHAAYLNYMSRLDQGMHGDEHGDWLAAEAGLRNTKK